MSSHPVSIRFRSSDVAERLKAEAAALRSSASALAEELIDEGLRLRHHPLITFRDGPAGRRAAVVGGPDVWEVIGALVGGDVAASARLRRSVEEFGWRRDQVEAAAAYYSEYAEEIDTFIAANAKAAEEAEARWRRQRDLLGR